eukprot:3355068-Prymnesium_polylepis.1
MRRKKANNCAFVAFFSRAELLQILPCSTPVSPLPQRRTRRHSVIPAPKNPNGTSSGALGQRDFVRPEFIAMLNVQRCGRTLLEL